MPALPQPPESGWESRPGVRVSISTEMPALPQLEMRKFFPHVMRGFQSQPRCLPCLNEDGFDIFLESGYVSISTEMPTLPQPGYEHLLHRSVACFNLNRDACPASTDPISDKS